MKKVSRFFLTSIAITLASASYADNLNSNAYTTTPTYVKVKKPAPTPTDTPTVAPLSNDPNSNPEANALQKGLSAELTFISNYVFRGISQSSNLPAVQGSLTYTFERTGFYLNLWGSNVNFLAPDGSQATVEFDTVAGFKNNIINDNFSYDISFDRYNYPKAAASYNEWLATLAYKILFIKLAYSPNAYNTHNDSHYYAIGMDYDIPAKCFFGISDVNFTGSVGHFSLPQSAGSSYNDYLLQLTKKVFSYYSVALAWTGTNDRDNTGSLGDNHLIASVIVDV